MHNFIGATQNTLPEEAQPGTGGLPSRFYGAKPYAIIWVFVVILACFGSLLVAAGVSRLSVSSQADHYVLFLLGTVFVGFALLCLWAV
jgi:threonine/homoserine/homoserine lactone efflux protein